MRTRSASLALLTWLGACNGARGDDGDPPELADDPLGCLVLDEDALTADAVRVGVEPAVQAQLWLRNGCEGDLLILGADLDGDSAFSLDHVPTVVEPDSPGEALGIRFDPARYGSFSATLRLRTSDPARSEVSIPIAGHGTAPSLAIDPVPLDLGAPWVGCATSGTWHVANAGDVALSIEGLSLSSDGDQLALADVPAVPVVLEPGEAFDLGLDYHPRDLVADERALVVISDDPARSEASFPAFATATSYAAAHEVFTQPPHAPLDLLITLDRDDTMQARMAAVMSNFDALLDRLVSGSADYQVALGVVGDGCVIGNVPWIDDTLSLAQARAALREMADISGDVAPIPSRTSSLLMVTEVVLAQAEDGGCNEGLVRDDTQLALLHVSDSADQSVNSWSYYVSLFESKRADPDDVRIHAVSGEYPSPACPDSDAGTGYYEATVASGGEFLSICRADWGEVIGDALLAWHRRWFALEAPPVEGTVRVQVDGTPVSTGWAVDGRMHRLVFDEGSEPRAGATVEVWYEVLHPSCR